MLLSFGRESRKGALSIEVWKLSRKRAVKSADASPLFDGEEVSTDFGMLRSLQLEIRAL